MEKAPWESEEETPPWDNQPKDEDTSFLQKLGRTSIESLPIAGSIAGGILGGSAGTLAPFPGGAALGAVGGSSLGAAGGKALEQGLKGLIYGEYPSSTSEALKEIGKEAAFGAVGELGGQAVGKVLSKGIEALPKLGHALTGVSEQEIKTYAKNADEIKRMANAADNSTIEAANQLRDKFNTSIASKIGEINQNLKDTLQSSTKLVDPTPIYDALENYKSKLDPHLWTDEVSQIENLQNKILNSSQGNQISVSKANEIKKFLQEKASSSYRNGEMFKIGKEAANAAKESAAVARNLIDKVEPGVTSLNSQLQKLHQIEESINSNILKKGATEVSLMGAGTGGNPVNVKALEELGKITDTNMLGDVQNLAAMRTFTNPPLLPMDTTGKSAARIGAASALGAIGGGPAGAVIGGALSSPMTLKGVIDTGRFFSPAAKALTPSAPIREMMYKGLIQKSLEKNKSEAPDKKPDQTSIMNKIKGSPYEQVLQRAKDNGGDQSFAAANFVLMNRDNKYRDLINNSENEIEA